MGSEQSSQAQIRHSRGELTSPTSPSFDPSISPQFQAFQHAPLYPQHHPGAQRHDSVASDLESIQEVPYVSYTINKPIGGDSPKKKKTHLASNKLKYLASSVKMKDSSHNTLVVVNKGEKEDATSNLETEDQELKRLKEIPAFLPIMRASLSGSSAKDPDILERLDYRGLLSMSQSYEDHLRLCSVTISTEQSDLNRQIKEVDIQIAKVTQDMVDRQKHVARLVDKMAKVGEMSKILSKCHMLLNENIEQMEILNNMLPTEDRLEPFVWTTG